MKRLLAISALFFMTIIPTLWAIPTEINFQGTIKGPGGTPINSATTPTTIKFTLTSSDGAIPYSNVITTNPQIVNGLFSVPLDFQLLSGITWDSITPYIKVNVAGEDLSAPQKVSATVYAVISNSVVDNAITTSKIADGSVTSAKLDTSVGNFLLPSGMIVAYAGASAPQGWLLCDGSLVSRATYPNLFTAIGTTWGVGDGVLNFKLPDVQGRTLIGSGQGAGLTYRGLTQTLGDETHTLTTAEMPSHSHGVNDPGHYHMSNVLGGVWGLGPSVPQAENGGVTLTTPAGLTSTAYTGISIQTTGGGGSHSIMQPSVVINYIIKT